MSAIRRLIRDFARLPGVGERTAERLVFHILSRREVLLPEFLADFKCAVETVRLCRECHNFTDEGEICAICRDPNRQAALLCVLESPSSLFAIEKTARYRGRYYILHGLLSPLDGFGPEELKIPALVDRLAREVGTIEEVILAVSTNVNGDATALYLARALALLKIRVTRLSSGLPAGAEVEYLDATTLMRAMENRVLV